ncbi:importin-13 [Clonorchis sinensis]|uniref:Importin-13 n=1 Tax=Clonorchis sinensis TaxID=79923 RepID=G7YSG1_CLOSI|nr:importin-13 [Clonorchis sinensis]
MIRERLLTSIVELRDLKSEGTGNISMLLKQLFKALVHLLFRTADSWDSPISFVISHLKNSEFKVLTQQPADSAATDANNFVVCFLSILVEEFSSANLLFHVRQQIKHLILKEESLVFQIFQELMASQTNEAILASVFRCCSLWLTNLSATTSATDCLNFARALYGPINRSEPLFSAGLDCLINLFEEGDFGLSSGRDTAQLLDFHIQKLAGLQPLVLRLVEAHSSAVHRGFHWEEFAQNELMSKTALLLLTLTERQMGNLWTRVLQAGEPHSAIHTLFDMFLFPMSLAGSYPLEESVSDLGVQIWFNVVDALPPICEVPQLNQSTLSFIEDLQCRFLNAAFSKCQFMPDLETFFHRWQSEQREQWYRLRSELADTFLAAYAHQQSLPFFVQLQARLQNLVDRCVMEEAFSDWQELEAIIFVFNSISEQVVHEVAHENHSTSQLASVVLSAAIRLAACMNGGRSIFEGSTMVGSLLCSGTLATLFRNIIPLLEPNKSLLLENDLVGFFLKCLFAASQTKKHKDVANRTASSSLKTIQSFIQELPITLTQSERIISTLGVISTGLLPLSVDLEAQLWKCVGLLLPFCGSSISLSSLIHLRLEKTKVNLECRENEQADPSSLHLSRSSKASVVTLFQPFVELFRGVSKTLNRVDNYTCDDAVGPPLPIVERAQIRESISRLLLQLVTYLTQSLADKMGYFDPESIEMVTELLKSGYSACFSSIMENPSILHCQDSLLERTVELTSRLLNYASDQLLPHSLELSWLVIDTLLRNPLLESRFSVGLHLLGIVLQHIDTAFTRLAVSALDSSDPMFDFGRGSCLEHPFPPILMGLRAQDITDQVEACATFIHHVLDWQRKNKESTVEYVCKTCLLNTYESFVGDSTALFWRLSFTATFAGLCLPEWNTVDCCIHLCQRLLTRLNDDNHHDVLPKVITPDFLFEIHAGLLLVLAKGALPRRLVNKYSDLYASLRIFFPDKQFTLLRTLLGCTDHPSDWSTFVSRTPHHQSVTMAVQNAVLRVNLSERNCFARGVTRSAVPLNAVKSAISSFTMACSTPSQ